MASGPQLQALIDKRDNRELIRDRIGQILKLELDGQAQRAQALGLNPSLYEARVFLEKSDAWSAFSEVLQVPIVNVWAENATFERHGSNVISRQKASGTFHIDCYGFGVSEDTQLGHTPGDQMALAMAERTARNVRNILMSGYYTYLGFPQAAYITDGSEQIVYGRFISSLNVFQPGMADHPTQRVIGIRLDLEVTYVETSQEYQGVPLQGIDLAMTKAPTGEVLARVSTP